MQTDKIRVNGSGEGADAALDEVTKLADYMNLDEISAMRLRLLGEEALGMVNAIAGDFAADFWLEGEKGKTCYLHLMAETRMNLAKKKELIATSSDKKNAAYKGFMGKIREILEEELYSADDESEIPVQVGMPSVYRTMGICDAETVGAGVNYQWSLSKYRENVDEAKEKDEAATEAWDELEKSIVANIADDVRVGVKGDNVELIIEKKF